MTKWTGRLKQLLSGQGEKPNPIKMKRIHTDDDVDSAGNEGGKYLTRVRNKLDKLVDDFTKGRVNRAQFEELYTHYQDERAAVERLMASKPSSDAWRMAVTEGQSLNIRRRYAARVLGYAVYANQDETPLRVYGEFTSLHDRWISPLLARVRSENDQLFVVGSFKTEGEEATCLCTVSGRLTTLLVLFTNEPARVQIQSLEDLHCHFEQANYRVFSRNSKLGTPVIPGDLVFPYAAAFE